MHNIDYDSDICLLLQFFTIRPLKLRVVFLIRNKIKKGRGCFFKTENDILNELKMLLYKNTCQKSPEEQSELSRIKA